MKNLKRTKDGLVDFSKYTLQERRQMMSEALDRVEWPKPKGVDVMIQVTVKENGNFVKHFVTRLKVADKQDVKDGFELGEIIEFHHSKSMGHLVLHTVKDVAIIQRFIRDLRIGDEEFYGPDNVIVAVELVKHFIQSGDLWGEAA